MEDLVVIGAFYARGDSLIMGPPVILISSNYKFNYSSLSKDRWLIYEIKNRRPQGLKQIRNIYKNKNIERIKKTWEYYKKPIIGTVNKV